MSCLCFCWPRRHRPSPHHAERAGPEPQAAVTELKTKKKKKWSFKRFLGIFRKKNKVGVEVPHQDQAEEGKVLQQVVEAANGVELPGVPERTSPENAAPEAEGLEEIINISSSTVKLLEEELVIIDLEREEDTTEKISRDMDAVEAEVAVEMIQDVSDAQADDASELLIVDLEESEEATEKPLDGRDGDDKALEELVNIDPVERDGDTGRFDKNEDLISSDLDTTENTWISRVNGPAEAERAGQKKRDGGNELAFLQLLMRESKQTTEKVLDKGDMIIIDLEKPEDTTQKGLISSNIDTEKAEMMMEKLLINDPQERMKVDVKDDKTLNKLMKTDQSKLEIIEIDDFKDNMEMPLDVEDVDAESVKDSSIIDLKKAEDTSQKILISRDMVNMEAKVAMKKVWQISEAHDDAFKELLITDLEENEEETTETPQTADVRAAEVKEEASKKKNNNKEETEMLDLDVKVDVTESPKNVVPEVGKAKSRRPAGSPMDDDALAEILKRQVKKLKRVRFILPIENGMSAGDLFHDIKFPSTKKEEDL
ncbi:uncharacterized protein LOC134302660 isoform X2 [Trichomycterus rosablanca]|uniref:uncharacterized protein LOC134302660 isoform X2 n=1 Tax=Trichomycterus rosablanca TaxID=2290929 RepID=UPI002F34FDFE